MKVTASFMPEMKTVQLEDHIQFLTPYWPLVVKWSTIFIDIFLLKTLTHLLHKTWQAFVDIHAML